MSRAGLLLILWAATTGCGPAGSDAALPADSGTVLPLAGFGALSGDCDLLEANDELTSSSPFFARSAVDFGTLGYTMADFDQLSAGGQEIILDGNAGGSSIMSEVFAYELLYRCEEAALLKTETEIVYTDPMGTITDFLVEMDGLKIGVSVTRAVLFPFNTPFTEADASALLQDKLQGVLDSSANVSAEDTWTKQILSVLAYGSMHAESLELAWMALDPMLRADTIVFVTVTDGADDFIY